MIERYGDADQYTMHRVIVQFARTKLERERSCALHRAAATYFEDKLKAQAGSNRGEYLYWYRFERADWQSLMDARLYHLSHAGNGTAAMLAFVQRYFDAFWWWGYYQRFEFCEQMLAEWKRRKIAGEFLDCLTQIERFEAHYATGYKKENAGDWREVRDALQRIRALLKVDDGGANLATRNGQQVHAFTGFFLAEAYAYGECDEARAVAAYAAAHQRFVLLEEPWVAAWIRFYEAQYRLELNQFGEAARLCARGLHEAGPDKPRNERDPELLANFSRLQGDLATAAADHDAAIGHYAAASLYAWEFQGIPEYADSYTMAFYGEIVEQRIATGLVELWQRQPALAVDHSLKLAAFWAPVRDGADLPTGDALGALLARADSAGLATAIFPSALAPEALREGAEAYGMRVRQLAPDQEIRLASLTAAELTPH